MKDHGRKISGKSGGTMENGVLKTEEEMRQDNDTGGVKDTG